MYILQRQLLDSMRKGSCSGPSEKTGVGVPMTKKQVFQLLFVLGKRGSAASWRF